MLYGYRKATSANPHPGRFLPGYVKAAPTILSAIGLGVVGSVVWPLISYNIQTFPIFNQENSGLLSPISYESQADNGTGGPKVLSGVDYTKASSWFPGSENNDIFNQFKDPQASVVGKTQDTYQISIPSLGIENAIVSIKSEDLTKSLIQYPETALPGQSGSPVIFGHSTLPQFFDPQKYTTIFSTLPKVKVGSDIFVTYDGLKYTYRVNKLYEVKPSELWVLRQDYSEKTLKVVTCVPPGTTLKRLIVEADLITN
jgi:sortase A